MLDENFPEPLVAAVLQVATPNLSLLSWKNVGGQVKGLSDAALIGELSHLGHNALVTCDYHMLNNRDVLAAMKQTNFTVIGCKDVGHDPVRATGLLLYNLEHISHHYVRDSPQPWLLASRQSSPRDFHKHVVDLETRLGRKLTDIARNFSIWAESAASSPKGAPRSSPKWWTSTPSSSSPNPNGRPLCHERPRLPAFGWADRARARPTG